LEGFEGRPVVRGYRNWVTARIRETIAFNRAINLYGERNARLSNLQTRGYNLQSRSPLPSWIFTILFFDKPNNLHATLRDLWIDKITYTRTWRAFAQEINSSLTESIIQDLILILTSIISLAVPFTSVDPLRRVTLSLNTTSVILAVASASLAIGLRGKYTELSKATSTTAGDYQESEFHKTYGFYPLAVKLSLPSVLFRWALVLFAIASTISLVNSIYVAWDDSIWSYVLVLPIAALIVPVVIMLSKILFWAVRSLRRQFFTSIALPLHTSDIAF